MVRLLAGLLLWFASAATGVAAPLGKASVEIRLEPGATYAVITLDRRVRQFAFQPADVVRKESIEVLSSGLSFADDKVTSDTPFRRIELRLRPSTRERDAKYPAFYTIGQGGLLYLPTLLGDETAWRTRMTVRLGANQVRAPATKQLADGYVYVGPPNLVTENADLVVVADPDTPRWLTDRASAELADAVRLFARAIGVPLPSKPVLVVKNINDGTGFVGDVTPGFVTALRFHGAGPVATDAITNSIAAFVKHEAFHFWNGGISGGAKGTPTWLHEGGADYAALLAAQESGASSDDATAQRLASALTACKSALEAEGNKPLSQLAFLTNRVRYPCGMVLQWAVDLHVRRTSGDQQTVLDTWGQLIRAALKTRSREYDLESFYSAAAITDTAAVAPLGLIIDENGADRWDKMVSAFAKLGAEIRSEATADTRRAPLIFHLLAQNCKALPENSNYGFWINGGELKLQSPAGCGDIAGDPVITEIEGGSPTDLTDTTYSAVQAKCLKNTGVRLTTGDGRKLTIACTKPLGPAPKGYVVTSWRRPPSNGPEAKTSEPSAKYSVQ